MGGGNIADGSTSGAGGGSAHGGGVPTPAHIVGGGGGGGSYPMPGSGFFPSQHGGGRPSSRNHKQPQTISLPDKTIIKSSFDPTTGHTNAEIVSAYM